MGSSCYTLPTLSGGEVAMITGKCFHLHTCWFPHGDSDIEGAHRRKQSQAVAGSRKRLRCPFLAKNPLLRAPRNCTKALLPNLTLGGRLCTALAQCTHVTYDSDDLIGWMQPRHHHCKGVCLEKFHSQEILSLTHLAHHQCGPLWAGFRVDTTGGGRGGGFEGDRGLGQVFPCCRLGWGTK